MAYIYSYMLEAGLRERAEDLRRYAGVVRETVTEYLTAAGCHVREVCVSRYGFELRLLPDVDSRGVLAAMCRKLREAEGMQGYYAPLAVEEKRPRQYFRSQPRRYMAYVRSLPDGTLHLDMVDAVGLGSVRALAQRALFFAGQGTGALFAGDAPEADVDDLVALFGGREYPAEPERYTARNRALARYMGCYIARVRDAELCGALREEAAQNGGWVRFEGVLKHGAQAQSGSVAEVQACPDYEYLHFLNRRPQTVLAGFDVPEYATTLAVDADSIAAPEKHSVRVLHAMTELVLPGAEGVDRLATLPPAAYWQLCVHDVGQGLAVSLSEQLEPLPLLYYDYGVDLWNRDKAARAALPIAPGVPVVLSHTHMDHWSGLWYSEEAFAAAWYLPRALQSVLLRNAMAQVLHAGGTAAVLPEGVSAARGALKLYTCRGRADKPHQSGLCMVVKIDGRRVLLAGDNEYTAMPASSRRGVNVLVASHHGGSYGGGYKDIPSPAEAEKVVYSYGNPNPYGQPTHKQDYRRASWGVEHHTPKHGSYTLP